MLKNLIKKIPSYKTFYVRDTNLIDWHNEVLIDSKTAGLITMNPTIYWIKTWFTKNSSWDNRMLISVNFSDSKKTLRYSWQSTRTNFETWTKIYSFWRYIQWSNPTITFVNSINRQFQLNYNLIFETTQNIKQIWLNLKNWRKTTKNYYKNWGLLNDYNWNIISSNLNL